MINTIVTIVSLTRLLSAACSVSAASGAGPVT
jgi:hypothetical protein